MAMPAYRSLLFVPGSRADRFGKAVAAGADAVIIDLEDAVLPGEKAKARSETLTWVSNWRGAGLGIRINSPRTAAGCADIAAIAGSAGSQRADFLVVPKVETPVDLEIVREAIGRRVNLIALIESGRALANVHAIAAEANGGLLFGGVDYSAATGADLNDWDALLTARGLIAAAAGAAGVPAYDVPALSAGDADALTATTRKARALGFSGRACIHPDQVSPVNAAFTPTPEELADARALVDAAKAVGAGAFLHKGKMIDRPVVLAAERLLSRYRPS
jgi:citrate lyase subunit beta/citryl-CoA lyase/(S)-citramalyl-CoA lyase